MGGNVNWHNLLEGILAMCRPFDPAIPPLGIYFIATFAHVPKGLCTRMFTVPLFACIKKGNNLYNQYENV